MIIINASSKKGKEMMDKAYRLIGHSLSDVYVRYSPAKERAYRRCRDLYFATDKAFGFAIVSANQFAFSCSWCGEFEGEPVTYYITKANDYMIYDDK